jgi:hypothetical protein
MEHGRRLSKALPGCGYRHFLHVTYYAGCRLLTCHPRRTVKLLAAAVGRAVIPLVSLGSAMRPGRTGPGGGSTSNEAWSSRPVIIPVPTARRYPSTFPRVVCHLNAPIYSRTVVACELAIGISHQGDNETPFRPIQRRLALYNPLKCLRSRFIPFGKTTNHSARSDPTTNVVSREALAAAAVPTFQAHRYAR